MSLHRDTIVTHSGNLHHVKTCIAIDPKIIAKREIKIGDTITGHVLLTNKKVLSCKGISIRLLFDAVYIWRILWNNELIKNGKTQDGFPLNVNAIPKGTYRFPFSLELQLAGMAPTHRFGIGDHKYALEVVVAFQTGVQRLYSMPITVSEYLNIRDMPEYYNSPIHCCIQGTAASFFGYDDLSNFKILINSPRTAYIAGEVLPFTLRILEGKNKIKKITVSLVMRLFFAFSSSPWNDYEDKTILSKTILNISDVIEENLKLPKDLKQIFRICCKIDDYFSLEAREYYLKFSVQSTGMRMKLQELVSIAIGTVDSLNDCVHQSPDTTCWPSSEELHVNKTMFTSYESVFLPTYEDIDRSQLQSPIREKVLSLSLESLPPTFKEALM